MSKTQAIFNTLRRISTTDSARRASKASVNTVQNCQFREADGEAPSGAHSTGLLHLPTELVTQVVEQLSFQDLSNMRLVSRDVATRVSTGDALRHWVKCHLDERLLQLYPPPTSPAFTYLANQMRRQKRAKVLAGLYTEYIEWNVVRHSLQRRHPYIDGPNLHREFTPVARIIRAKIYGLLLTIQHYLESCADILLDLCQEGTRDKDSSQITEYVQRERQILHQYKPKHLSEVYQFWLFLTWLNDQVLDRPSYVGTFERGLRGWMTDPVKKHLFLLVLFFGNLRALTSLMREKSYKGCRKAVEGWIRRLNPETCSGWQHHWAEFGLQFGASLTKQQATAALQVKLEERDIFLNSAGTVLQAHGLLQTSSYNYGTPQQCTDFLNDIAGYDVMRILPSMRPLEVGTTADDDVHAGQYL